MKLVVVVPSYEGNPEIVRVERHIKLAREFLKQLLPDLKFDYVLSLGEKVPADPHDVEKWILHDRAIAKCRWAGLHRAFDELNADWVLMLDTDLFFPPDFFWRMMMERQDARAKTCHIESILGEPCRHVDWPSCHKLPDTQRDVPIAGEVIMLHREVWEKMDKVIAAHRANEDFEIAEKVRAAGYLYALTSVRILAD